MVPPMASSSSSSRLFFSNFLSAPSSSSPSPSLIPRRSPSFRFETATNYSKQLKMKRTSSFQDRSIAICFALAESSDSPNPIGKGEDERKKKEELRILLQELVECFDFPTDFLANLPRDLRLDLNDAAFDLSNGAVYDECGQELGDILMNLSRAWEQADTTTSRSITSKFASLESSLTDNVKAAFGKRLLSSGRRFTSMGQYGQGEVQKIANAMTKTGKFLLATPMTETEKIPKSETRILKFGSLQVELTPQKAYIGSVIAFVFGIITWKLAQGIEGVPENSLEYANDNALSIAKSLRGTMLALGYSSTFLSAASSVGLVFLAQQLASKADSDPQE